MDGVRPEIDDEHKGFHDKKRQTRQRIVGKEGNALPQRIAQKLRLLVGRQVVDQGGSADILQPYGPLDFPCRLPGGQGSREFGGEIVGYHAIVGVGVENIQDGTAVPADEHAVDAGYGNELPGGLQKHVHGAAHAVLAENGEAQPCRGPDVAFRRWGGGERGVSHCMTPPCE